MSYFQQYMLMHSSFMLEMNKKVIKIVEKSSKETEICYYGPTACKMITLY